MGRFTLRLILPGLVSVFFVVVTLVAYATSRHFVLQDMQTGLQRDMLRRLSATQGTLERFMLLRHPEGVQKVVSAFGSDLDIGVALVTDRDGRVLFSTDYQEQGQPWASLGYGIDTAVVGRVTRSFSSEVAISDDERWINGYISVCDPYATSALRVRQCGFLFHQVDLQHHRNAALESLRSPAKGIGVGLLFCALLMMFIAHRYITVPVTRIVDTLGRFSRGTREARTKIHGQDELAILGQSVDMLLDRVVADEAALRRSEQLSRAIIDGANVSIISTNSEGLIQSFNAGAERMLGYLAEELINIQTPAVIHDPKEVAERAMTLSHELGREIAPGFEVFVAKARHGRADENEWTYIAKDGSRRTVSLSVTALFDDAGDVTGFLGVARDISEEIAVVQRLRLAEKVFESAGEAILVTDARTRVVDVNPAYLEVTGFSREEIIGATPKIANSGRHDPAFYREMWKSIMTTGSWSGEVWDRRKSGEIFPQLLTINQINDSHGQVSHYVGIFKDISHQKAIEQKLERLAYYDPLTNLPNRTLFRDRLEHQIQAARRSGASVALLFVDLDQFKYVNDTLGHDTGDKLLIEAARRIEACVRKSDTVARLGGDEFTLVLPGLQDVTHAGFVADKVISRLQEVFQFGGNDIYIGASIGIALYPQDGEDFVTLTKNADAAMYLSKQSGRGRYKFFAREMNSANTRRLTVESGLRQALERGELYLHYQPKLALNSKQVLGFEALLRWRHSELGDISPAEFIPLAEENGAIVPIGNWVLRTACTQLRRWHDAGHPNLHIAVNLSARQFQHDALADEVRGVLEQLSLPPGALELELTESLLMSDVGRSLQVIETLQALGVGISVDDFGTGYSSLSYLKKFPIQALKIDRSFVRDIAVDADDAAIVRAIISLADRLRLQVVAEGVETREQHEFLRSEGCNQAQGFHYAPPLPADQALDFLRTADRGRYAAG